MNRAHQYFVVASLLACACVHAQVSAPLPGLRVADEQIDKANVVSISAGEVPGRVLEENLFLRKLAQGNASASQVDSLEQELAEVTRSANKLRDKIREHDFELLPLSGYEALARYLAFLDKRLTKLQSDLQSVTRPLSDDAGELAAKRKLWQQTRLTLESNLPLSLLDSIDELNREFEQRADESAKPLKRLLDYGREASAVQKAVSSARSIVRDRIDRYSQKLWAFDADDLFSAIQKPAASKQEGTQAILNSFAIQMDFMKTFDRAFAIWHGLVVLLALISLPAFLGVSRSARNIINSEIERAGYQRTLGRPVSAWLLFVILCLLIVDINGPWFQLRLLLALAWLPVMRLQSKWIHENVGFWIYATAPFFCLSVIGQLITALPLDHRLLVLYCGILLLAVLLWLFFLVSRKQGDRGVHQWSIAKVLMAIHIVLVSIALVANILGGTDLSVLLTETSVNSLYLALFLCAAHELVGAYAYALSSSHNTKFSVKTQQVSRLFQVSFNVFKLALVLAWIVGLLNSLRVLGFMQSLLISVFEFRIEVGSIAITIGGVVLFCTSVFLSFWIARSIRSVLSDDVLPNMTLPRGVANSVSTMTYYFLLMLGLLIALTAAGLQFSQLALVIGALGVGIGLGLQSVVSNFVSGIILMIERPIQPGDTVEISGTTGKVRDIGIRTTTLATFDGADVVVPNGMLLSEKMTNWTLNNDKRRIEIPVGVAYGNDMKAVQSLLLNVANGTQGINGDPPPVVLFVGFGESSLDFSVRAWVDDYAQSMEIRSELAIAIYEALRAAGISIPFPQRDVNVRVTDV